MFQRLSAVNRLLGWAIQSVHPPTVVFVTGGHVSGGALLEVPLALLEDPVLVNLLGRAQPGPDSAGTQDKKARVEQGLAESFRCYDKARRKALRLRDRLDRARVSEELAPAARARRIDNLTINLAHQEAKVAKHAAAFASAATARASFRWSLPDPDARPLLRAYVTAHGKPVA